MAAAGVTMRLVCEIARSYIGNGVRTRVCAHPHTAALLALHELSSTGGDLHERAVDGEGDSAGGKARYKPTL